MNSEEIIKKHPKSVKIIIEWFTKKMFESFKDKENTVPEEVKHYMEQRGVSNEQLITFININPRVFFDVFDNKNILIGIEPVEKNNFSNYIIDNGVRSPISKRYNSRINCEKGGFERAINLLEKKLSNEK